MLQVVSGKFFDLTNVYETWHRGALFTNYRMWGHNGLETSVGTVYAAVSTSGPLMLTYELLERMPKGDGEKPGMLISTGGQSLVNDFSAVFSFALNVTCTPDPDLARRLVIDDRPTLGSSSLPRALVPRVFDKEVSAKAEDEADVNVLLDKIISLKRADFEAVMRSIQQYVVATHRLSDSPELAYTIFVAAVESLAKDVDGFRQTWDDFDEQKRLKLDGALEGAEEAMATRVREALLDVEHTKLKSRFIGFTLKHLRGSYFREETHPTHKCISRSDLNKALSGAYDIRSRYIHKLRPLPRHLSVGPTDCEYADDGTGPLLNFAGLARLVRHVILNFIDECEPGLDEGFELNQALPNIVTMRLASRYWISNVDGFSARTAKLRLAAHFQELARAKLGHAGAQVTDISAVLAKIEEILPSLTKPEVRLPMIALYFSFNFVVPETYRSAKWSVWREVLEPELHEPSLPTLFYVVLTGNEPDWDLSASTALAERYFATKFHRLEMNVEGLVETILLLWLAERHRLSEDEERAREYLSRAVENSPANRVLQNFERAAKEGVLREIDWRTLLAPDEGGQRK